MEPNVKEYLIKTIKEAWTKEIEDTVNVKEIEVLSLDYIDVLKSIDKLHAKKKVKETEIAIIEKESQERLKAEDDNNIYVLHRKLLGGEGVNTVNDNTIFIPESVVRKEGMQHGDKLEYKENGIDYGRHFYKKVESVSRETDIEPNEIISYDYAIVEYDDSLERLVCKSNYENGKRTTMLSCLINDKDKDKYNIKENDIVSIAHMPNRSMCRVRWKYDASDPIPTPIEKKPSFYKEKSAKSDIKKENVFNGISIGIFGATTFINGYIEEIESRGGKVYHTESDVEAIIENVVKKSDIVVIPIRQTSHSKAEQAKAKAKKYEKAYIILESNGRNNLVMELTKALEEI